MPLIDQPTAVRAGEELDAAALAAYLARTVPAFAGATADELEVQQFGAGFSNLTYLVRAGDAEAVLRRPPFGARGGSAHDMAREHRILAALAPTYGKVPRPLAYCDDPAVLGAPFYVMERVHGVILRGRPPQELALAATTMRALSETFVDELAAIHAVDVQATGLAELGKPEGYVERQLSGWTRRWTAARSGDVPEIERLASWLAAHQPPESAGGAPAALIHNDFKYDNLVLAPDDLTRVIAVLDWEMATVGDPLMDLGTSLGYWVEPDDPLELRALGLGLTALPGNLTRAELVARYAERTGRAVPPERAAFYYAYGLFKIAVVAQQIYARYVAGHTKDPRFARLDVAVRALGGAAERVAARGAL